MKRKHAEPHPPRRLCRTSTRPMLVELADFILDQITTTTSRDVIHLCGVAPMRILPSRTCDVLALAQKKLQTWPYSEVSTCWRRLYEDASLYRAAAILRSDDSRSNGPTKVSECNGEHGGDDTDGWFTEIVHILDRALIVSGAPARRGLIGDVLEKLRRCACDSCTLSQSWVIDPPASIRIDRPVPRAEHELSYEGFALHLVQETTPLVITGMIEGWPARSKWQHLTYLMEMTIGGRRLVPVEIGQSYTSDTWTQSLMSFKEFAEQYLIPAQPNDIGYLAQHDFLAQIPALRGDVIVPDFCWTTPPPPADAAAETPGLKSAPELEEPLVNAWLGPKGTRTPLHTDPYHNILCQVVGYKYVRLYAPEQTSNVYPLSRSETNIDMSNTSCIPTSLFQPNVGTHASHEKESISKEFPSFAEAIFTETVLAPGECLYIPLGYWHYVESLTPSFSVSFWWN